MLCDMATLWEKFETALKARGIKQVELEEMLGLPKNRISKWKNKTENFPVGEALRIARALGIDLDYLADDARADVIPVRPYNAEERALIGVFRGCGLSLEEAAERLRVGREAKEASGQPGKAARRHLPR